MFKRITCLLLVVTMVFSMMPMQVLASQMEPAEVAAAEPASTTAATEEETTIPETTQAAEPETTTVCTEDAKESDAVIDSDFSELPDEDAPDETIVETVLRYEEEPADSEVLFEGFLNKLFFGEDERSPQAILAGNRLARIDKYIYDALIPVIQQIARGQRSSTVVSVDLAGTGFLPEQANIPLLAEALTHDFPFEMYWYSGIYVSYSSNSSKMTLKLQVNAAYQASNYNAESPAINTTRAKTATQAVENARAIVNQYAGYSDYNKLTAYADKICALVKYDHYAADNDTYSTNINPWTLINVFDNDSTTNVVCNGYAEAFQYLCDLSDFDGDIVCYSPGGAEHRWNIVRIDGKSYLMDVTHCDDGNKATRNDKFMGGGSGSVEAGYRIGGFHYWYYDDVKETWGTGPNSILALSDKKYDPNSTPAPPPAGDTSQSELESALATCGGSYRLSKKVTLTSDMVLDGVNLTIASGGTLIVSAGTTLAVKKNASITLEKGSVLRINAAGVLLQSGKVKNNSGTFTKNGIICESADDYLLHLINECHKLSANEIRTKIGYLDKSLIASALTANQDDFIYKLSALEEAVGGAVAVEPGELFSDLKAEDFTVIGANLNMPKYTGAQMKVVIEKAAKQPDDHFFTCTMRLKNAENETELQIPVIVLMKNPSYKSGMNVKNIAVRHMNEDGTQVLSRINQGEYSWTFILQNFGTIGFTLDNQGICGDNARWNYDNQTATLTVTGTGAMNDYDSEKPDWEGYLETVKSVVVQSGITHIGAHAFRGCKALLSVTMANSVTSLGVQIFTSCEKLRDVKLSENIKTLPRSTFSFCNSLIQITLPEKLEVLDNQVFWNSPRLTSIVIPRNVKSIGSLCFSGCTSLKSVTFVGNAPTFVKYDEYNNFEDVTATVYYPANNTTWSSSVMQNYGGNLTWVAGCTDGHTIVITKGQPATCTEPGISDGKTCSVCGAVIALQTELAALGHDIISDREVPPTCTAPGHEAGSHCSRCDYTEGRNNIPALGHVEVTDAYVAPTCTQTGLTEGSHCSRCNAVLVKQTVLPAKGHSFEDAVCTVCGAAEVLEGSSYDGLTWNLDENGKLTISGTGDMYYTPWKTYADRIRSVEIQTGSTRIYRDAFSNCVNLTKVTMADTVAEIYSGAFEGSAALTTVTMSKNVTEIGASAFEGCASLTSITIPLGVATIEYYTFKDCTSLQAINIPGSVKEIGWNAFEGCTALRSVSLSQGLEIMESGVFEGCTSLSSIEIPKTVQEIGGSAFNGCTNLWSVNIPSGIEIIEYSTFEGCSKLSRITIPATVKEIGSHAFRDCTSLTSVTVPQGVTTLGAGVFRGCTALYSVSLPKSLESVSYDLFAYCTSLYDVNIPSGLTELSDFMFNSCESLTQITIPNTVTTIGRAAFAGCLGLKEITLPASVATLGSRAFTNCNNLKSIKVSSANEFFSADAYGVVYNKDKTVLVLIPGGLTGSYTIPEGVVIVGKDAVCNGKKLTGITFPSTLTAIEEYAFSNCSALTDAWFKGNAPVIAEFAFEDTTLTARYPVGDTSWTAEKLQNYGGSITWVASCINGHAEVLQPGVPATCTEEGISEGKYCSVCGDVIARQEVIPALGHAEVIEGYVAPTCTETGHTEGRHCERCGEIFAAAEEIPALGHKEVADAYVAPTCTKIGLTEGSHCDRCGEVFVEQERIPALGHDFLEGTCLRCGAPDKADYDLFSGKSLTLKPINPDTGKAYTAKQLTWSMDSQYEAFATLKSGKLTAKVVLEKVRTEIKATVVATGEEISYLVDIFPAVTQLEVLRDGEVVNGKTLNVDFDQRNLTLTADAYPLDTLKNIQWTVSDKKNAYAENYIIDENGLTVVDPTGKTGTVTVTATVNAGTKKTATVKLQFAKYAQEVQIETPARDTIVGGESLQLYAAIIGGTSKPGITWSIPDKADKTAASISSKGLLKAKQVKQPETIAVVATSKDGKAQASVEITILPSDYDAIYLMHQGMCVTGMTTTLNVGDTSQLKAHSQRNGEETVTWKSSKPSVATVSSDGLITAVGNGSAKITAEKPGEKAVFVNVKVTTMVSDMTLTTKDGKNLVTENGETIVEIASSKSATLAAMVFPTGANKAVTWEIIEGGGYAKISSSGKITANKDLTSVKYVTVRATAKDGSGYSETIRVRIRPLATGVQIYSQQGGRTTFSVRTPENWWVRSNTTLTVDMADTRSMQLLSHVYPYYNGDNARNAIQDVTWKSSSNKIATIDADGNVTFLKTGTVTITATAMDGSGKKVTFKLKIV